jgi:hypothetical protein
MLSCCWGSLCAATSSFRALTSEKLLHASRAMYAPPSLQFRIRRGDQIRHSAGVHVIGFKLLSASHRRVFATRVALLEGSATAAAGSRRGPTASARLRRASGPGGIGVKGQLMSTAAADAGSGYSRADNSTTASPALCPPVRSERTAARSRGAPVRGTRPFFKSCNGPDWKTSGPQTASPLSHKTQASTRRGTTHTRQPAQP